jgi:hypothetical protein
VTTLAKPLCVACKAECHQGARKTPLGWICAACAYILDDDE